MSQQDNARSNSLRILIADDEPLVRLDLRKMLENMGHQIVGEAGNGAEAVDAARLSKPDVVILDIKMPVMDGIEAAETISSEGIAPVLLLTAYSQADLVERAREAGVYAYMIKPFKEADLLPSIELAMARFAQLTALESTASTLEERLETRKTVERAKGVLIDRYGLKEHEAFRRLQMQSMNTRKSMREIAEAVLIAHSVEPPKSPQFSQSRGLFG
jgi:AmiR/NasT family two-component response regulator